MKVKCRSCGKQFDYEENSGQCPKCVSYYRLEPDWEAQDDTPKGEEQAIFQDAVSAVNRQQASQTSASTRKKVPRPKRSKTYYVLTVILIVAILLVGAIPISIASFNNQKNFDEMAEASIVTPKELSVGESFDYSIQDYDYSTAEEKMMTYQVEITGVHYDTDSRLMLPQGYEMVVAEYEVTAPYKKSDIPGMENSSSSLFYGVEITPYLITGQEQYISPFDDRKIQSMKGEERAPFATDDFHYAKGELYFLVKQGDAAGLLLNCMEPGENADKLKESYVIRNMEVK